MTLTAAQLNDSTEQTPSSGKVVLKDERTFPYDTAEWKWKELVTDILLDDNPDNLTLETLHLSPHVQNAHVLTFAADQNLYFHRKYYDSPKLEKLLEVYRDFVASVIAPLYDEDDLVVQTKPTFRVHLPNNTAVPSDVGGDPERPGLHCDSDYNHPEVETNFWVPFTDTTAENCIYLESEPQKGDYRPMLCSYGRVLQFWGAKCRHYNRLNDKEEAQTRVSFDFRVMTQSAWDSIPKEFFDNQTATVQAKMTMTIGSYYMKFNKHTGFEVPQPKK